MKNLNRRRLALNRIKLSNLIFIIIFIGTSLLFYYEKKNISLILKNTISEFSKNFEYQYLYLNIKGLQRVEKKYVDDLLEKYLNTSIFLLPLNEISKSLQENNWIKKIRLNTNYKDTLFVEIEEYNPIGIYLFNGKYFFFDESGKIIEEKKNNTHSSNSLIIFEGQSSNLNAKLLINILKSLNFQKSNKIQSAEYVSKRRWNIFLTNNTKLMLSEEFPKKSLENFINIIDNLSETEFNNVQTFDLRNIEKTLVTNK